MGGKWSELVKENAFGTYGAGVAKAMYLGIEGADRFIKVKRDLDKHEDIDNRLGDKGIQWPAEEYLVNEWFEKLDGEQDEMVCTAFREIAERYA